MNTYARLVLISLAFRGCEVGIQGTRTRHDSTETHYSTRVTDFHTTYDFTCPKGRLKNEPAGVAIMIPRGMESHVRSVHAPRD